MTKEEQLEQIDEAFENQKLLYDQSANVRCYNCDCPLHEGDHYFNILGDILCDDCADNLYGDVLEED